MLAERVLVLTQFHFSESDGDCAREEQLDGDFVDCLAMTSFCALGRMHVCMYGSIKKWACRCCSDK